MYFTCKLPWEMEDELRTQKPAGARHGRGRQFQSTPIACFEFDCGGLDTGHGWTSKRLPGCLIGPRRAVFEGNGAAVSPLPTQLSVGFARMIIHGMCKVIRAKPCLTRRRPDLDASGPRGRDAQLYLSVGMFF